jgi:hypothetical protein
VTAMAAITASHVHDFCRHAGSRIMPGSA